MRENKYNFNGKLYSIKPLSLDILHKVSPLLVRFKQEHYRLTKDIDMRELTELESGISELENAIDGETNKKSEDTGLKEKLQIQLKELKKEYNSVKFTSVREHILKMESLALLNIITDAEFISKMLNIILDCQNSDECFTVEKINTMDAFKFIKQVIADFFLNISEFSKV
ncbi:MAG: hypothetical protein IT280_06335 [Ignavibacteria bacterium]|nr:hypothetical protein [Ignavibacteria bacterium]